MVAYAKQREQFGKPIAAHQLVQELIADSAADVAAVRLLTWRAADLKARGERYALTASKAKPFATEASVRVANNCIQVHGYIDEFLAGKYLRDAWVATLYEGTVRFRNCSSAGSSPGFPRSSRRIRLTGRTRYASVS